MQRNSIYKNARELRKEMTEAEQVFWRFGRDRKVHGIKFRRQHPIGKYVLDFYWAERMVCIEIDGGIHDTREAKEYDKERTHWLGEKGIRVIRFSNEEVLTNIGVVMKKIVEFGGGLG